MWNREDPVSGAAVGLLLVQSVIFRIKCTFLLLLHTLKKNMFKSQVQVIQNRTEQNRTAAELQTSPVFDNHIKVNTV